MTGHSVGRGAALLLLAGVCMPWPTHAAAGRRSEDFGGDWRFQAGSPLGAEGIEFDDRRWTPVRLPHDWAIGGPFDPNGNAATGKLPWKNEGWYRKHFRLPAEDAGRRVFLDFDGVMANPTVWVNNRKAGEWDYGYCPFRVDITDCVRFGADNVVAVHVDARNVQTRWYPGAGIYRKVRLVVAEPVHVGWNGVWIRTTVGDDGRALAAVAVTLENSTTNPAPVKVEMALSSPEGRAVGRAVCEGVVPGGDATNLETRIEVADPQRWDLDTPRLYRATATVVQDGQTLDEQSTRFGFRTSRFDAAQGFMLNGRRVPIKGVCLHHDLGPLGAAFNTRAMERQLELLKEMGCNAIRTSHNIPAAEVLDLCDRMGFLVYAEVFDKWSSDRGFAAYADKQIRNFVLRDRNHPCVILWGAGNELAQQRERRIAVVGQRVAGSFKRYDPDRPVTLAVHAVPAVRASGLDAPFDVTSVNYSRRYIEAHAQKPDKPVLASETASAVSTRGHYELPHNVRLPTPGGQISSYDRRAVTWGSLPDDEFAGLAENPYVAGEFVWSGFDYLGEPTPYNDKMVAAGMIKPGESARSSFFGILDLCGLPKDRYYLYRSQWAPDKPTVHLLPHWNWEGQEGKPIPVYVYTSGDSAELFLNGQSLGRKAKDPQAKDLLDRYRLRWEGVAYRPGQLKAVAYKGTKAIGEAVMMTAGRPAKLRLTADRPAVKADGEDLIFVTVEVLDKDGHPCPNASDLVRYDVSRGAEIAAIGNGDPHSLEPFVADRQQVFHGKGVVILRSREGRAGDVRLVAKAAGLDSASLTVKAE